MKEVDYRNCMLYGAKSALVFGTLSDNALYLYLGL